jgi:ABC-type sugar transport system permease subunit
LGLKSTEKASVFLLLFPFFGLWVFFWLVPLIFGVDLALQNPSFSPEYRDLVEGVDEDSGFHFNWLDSPVIDKEETESPKYVGLDNFNRVLDDDKFYKALKNTSFYVFGAIVFILPLGFALSLALFQLSRISRGFFVFCLLIPGSSITKCSFHSFLFIFSWPNGCIKSILCCANGVLSG